MSDRELTYYKRIVDELAAARLTTEQRQWALVAQLRQKRLGFLLLSRLTRVLAGHDDAEAILRLAVDEQHGVLGMDVSLLFAPGDDGLRLAHARGLTGQPALAPRLGEELLAAGVTLRRGCELCAALGLRSLVSVALGPEAAPSHLLIAGRAREDASFCPPLDEVDVETFRALAATLSATMLGRRLEQLEASRRWKDDFFSELSHELRTPLTLTVGPLEQVLAGRWGEVPAAVGERLRVVQRSQNRLLDLVNEILALARMQAGAAPVARQPIDDLPSLLDECAAHFHALAEVRGLSFEVELDAALDRVTLSGDRARLERLLFNLLSNAFKFTEAGRVSLSARVDGETLELAVSDTGIGFPELERERLFTRFQRGTQAGHTSGSGIGLAVVQEVAALHGGEVLVESQPGRGACFRVRLPLGRAVAPPPPPVDDTPACNREAEASFDASRPVVLCVEDDAELRAYLRDLLRDEFNVYLAADGEDGLVAAQRYLPDVVVTDQVMPRMDGRELLARLRADADLATTPVVLLSARDTPAVRVASLVASADDYVGKPFDGDELRARVRNLARSRQHARQLAESNRRLELRVREQMAELIRSGELRRYLPGAFAERLLATGDRPLARREISLLVVEVDDLVGDPALLDEYLDGVAAIAGRHGGTVESMAGGRASILFGAPDERPVAEACRAAHQAGVELRAQLVQLGAAARRRGLPSEWRGRVALATGTCLVGTLGGALQRTYTAVGPAVQTAARLLREASDGVVCDARSRELLAGVDVVVDVVAEPLRSIGVSVPPANDTSRVFRREGEYWTIAYERSMFRLHDSKGLEYIARLLAAPHAEQHVLHLAGGPPHESHAGELLDARAKREYRERLEALDDELAEAERLGDAARVARVEEEVEVLAGHLSAAVGLGGRDRRAGSLAERARINVSRAIKSAVGKIDGRSRELARHLRTTIRTGSRCAYAPPPDAADDWDVALG